MAFAPDYGLRLMQIGLSREVEITFYDVPLTHIEVIAPGRYCTTANTVVEGTEYALTFDFDDNILEQMLFLLPDVVASATKPVLKETRGTPKSVELAHSLILTVTARLGALEKAPKEQFIPLIILHVSPGKGALDTTSSSYDVKEFRQDPRFRALKAQAAHHWKAFRPNIFKSLQQQGQLEAALDEAAVKALRTQDAYLADGYPEDGAWEAARQHIFLNDETDNENSDNYDFEAEWLAQKESEAAMFSLPNGRCVSAEELESGLEEWQFTGNQPGDVIDGPFIYQDRVGGVHAIRVISLRSDEVERKSGMGTRGKRVAA